ncbi:hypothetical protein MP228_006576 [Amoeboaphelidium protococcarum]|nr:hypothetical protein MP228_006576 [Amoeboaphelidium protococcarum]
MKEVKQNQQIVICIWMGVSGTGKSTLAQLAVDKLGTDSELVMIEGDDFHSEANVQKMRTGIPLEDDDRWPWLKSIGSKILENCEKVENLDGVIVTCSCLKKSYRDYFRSLVAEYVSSPACGYKSIEIYFFYLKGSFDLILQRVDNRKGHFMGRNLLKSQFQTLEDPESDGTADVISIDLDQYSNYTPQQLIDNELNRIKQLFQKN